MDISIGDREISCQDGKMIKYDKDCVNVEGMVLATAKRRGSAAKH